jgi:hypothetical protein
MRGRSVALIGITFAAAVAGCLLGSFSDIEGSGIDASTDAVVESASDAPIGSDANVVVDSAVVDANPGVRFCATQDATFCDDFDQVDAAPFALWEPPNLGSGSSVILTNDALSAPNALLATVATNDNTLLIPANISHQIPGTATTARYEYDLLVDSYDLNGSSAYIGAMDERVGLADTEIRLILGSSGLQLTGAVTPGDGGATIYPQLSSKVTVNAGGWHHVKIEVEYSLSPASVTFTFDTTVVADHVAIQGATFGIGNVTIQAAFLYASSPTTGWKIRVDNVQAFTQ